MYRECSIHLLHSFYLTIIIKKRILDIASCIGYILIVLFLVAVIIKLHRDNKEEETRYK